MGNQVKVDRFYRCGEQLNDSAYRYEVSGLEGIYLLNGYTVEHKSGEEFVSVADVDGLHKQIGLHLVMNRKVLTPKEIRFVRKTMDMTQAELGKWLGANSQTVARWEKGMTEMPGASDRLLRVFFVAMQLTDDETKLREFLLSKLIQLDCKDEVKPTAAGFEHNSSWHERAMEVA